jgi:phosphonatase-like hydrolase
VQLVVFDLAGTTVNDDDSVNRCIRDALAAVGLVVAPAAVNAVMGLPKPEALAVLVQRYGRDAALIDRLDAIHRDFVARSIAFYQDDPTVHEVAGAAHVFQELKWAGVRIALNTGFNRPITRVILDRLGWSQSRLIDATICSDEVPRGRPHPDMIRELMRRLNLADPRAVAKVGDTPADLEEGFNAGCGLIVGVTRGTHTRDELARYPHTHLVETVADVPGLLGLLGER